MIRLLLFLLCCLPCPAAADRLYKCVDGDGRLAYQSSACASGSRELWVREVLPEASPPRPAAQVAKSQPPPPTRRVARTARGARDPAASRCANARRTAEQRRDRDWNRLSFRQRSELDATVARACAR
jgi:hypothetical protein